mgnify:CR=1 FL=1
MLHIEMVCGCRFSLGLEFTSLSLEFPKACGARDSEDCRGFSAFGWVSESGNFRFCAMQIKKVVRESLLSSYQEYDRKVRLLKPNVNVLNRPRLCENVRGLIRLSGSMERFFLNLKMERVLHRDYANHAEAEKDVARSPTIKK